MGVEAERDETKPGTNASKGVYDEQSGDSVESGQLGVAHCSG